MGVGSSLPIHANGPEQLMLKRPPLPPALRNIYAQYYTAKYAVSSLFGFLAPAPQPDLNDFWPNLFLFFEDDMEAVGQHIEGGVISFLVQTLEFLATRPEPLEWMEVCLASYSLSTTTSFPLIGFLLANHSNIPGKL